MSKNNFLCANCRREMCDDCKSIADEYAELLAMRTRALVAANQKIEELLEQLKTAKRQSADWERHAKLGMPELILAWLDSQVKGRP